MIRSTPVVRAVTELLQAAAAPPRHRLSVDTWADVGIHAYEREGSAPCVIVREPLGPARRASVTGHRGMQLELLIEVPAESYTGGYDARAYLESLHAWADALLRKQTLNGEGFNAPIPVAAYGEPTTAEHDRKRSVFFSYASFTVALFPL